MALGTPLYMSKQEGQMEREKSFYDNQEENVAIFVKWIQGRKVVES